MLTIFEHGPYRFFFYANDNNEPALLLGRPSGESQRSFQRWLDERAKRQKISG
jgi:hypothetical protein